MKKSKARKFPLKNPVNPKGEKKKRFETGWLPPLCVTLLTFVAFVPVLQNGFVNWDDVGNLTQNLHYRGLGWRQLRWMFSNFSLGLYRPVTWMTFGLDYLLWGMTPAGYHLTSLLFHCANALLFYFVALRLLRLGLSVVAVSETTLRLAAGFAALFFSLHPLRVEAVAWASARGDVVAAFFLLAALLGYLRATVNASDAGHYKRWLSFSLLMYGISLLAKGSGIPFPFVLVALDFYPLRRLPGIPQKWFAAETRRIWWEKVPFLLLALAAGVAAVVAKRGSQELYSTGQYGQWARIAESLYGLSFYLFKTMIPLWLSPLYQRPDRLDPSQSIFWAYLSAVCIGVVLTVALLALRRRWPAGLTIWIVYALMLVPVLGIVQFGFQAAADRYTYLACLSWALLAGAALAFLWQLGWSGGFRSMILNSVRATFIVLLCFLGLLSWRQTQLWHDSERLWRHALTIDPNSRYVYINLAEAILTAPMKDVAKVEEAISYYRKAASLRSDWTLPLFNLGAIFVSLGDFDEAARYYRRIMTIEPNSVNGYQRLASVLAKQGRFEESVALYSKALELEPKDASVHNDFGNTLVMMGQLEKAIARYREAIALDPTLGESYFNLGNLMVRQNDLNRAIEYYRQALEADPNYAEAHHNLGRVLAAEGKLDEAVDHFRQAVRIEPNFMAARASLVLALEQQGKIR